MSATVIIAETNGPSGSSVETQDVANINFGSADQAALNPATYPIVAKADGHSFEKWLRLLVSDLGTSSVVDNCKVWLSNLGGGWDSGEGMSCNLKTSGYAPATYPAGGPVDTNSSVATVAMPEIEPSGANIGIGGTLTGQVITAPTNTDWICLQLDVSEVTPAGALNQKTITFQWDEM